MKHQIHYRLMRRNITQEMLEKALSMSDYAKKYSYTLDGVRYRIATRKIIAFKRGGRVYCVDNPL